MAVPLLGMSYQLSGCNSVNNFQHGRASFGHVITGKSFLKRDINVKRQEVDVQACRSSYLGHFCGARKHQKVKLGKI